MSWFELDEPVSSQYCTAVRIGLDEDEDAAEVIIFYTPEEGSLSLFIKLRVVNGIGTRIC